MRFTQFWACYSKAQIAATAADYTNQYWFYPIQWPIYESQAAARDIDIDLTTNQSCAAKDAFADYIWVRMEAENS
jgi:hypothetical protein